MFIQLTGFGRWTKCQFICLWWVIFLWIIHSYLIRDTNKKMLKTLYFVWSSGSPLFYLFDFILSERACHGSDEWDSTRSAYRVSLRKKAFSWTQKKDYIGGICLAIFKTLTLTSDKRNQIYYISFQTFLNAPPLIHSENILKFIQIRYYSLEWLCIIRFKSEEKPGNPYSCSYLLYLCGPLNF